MVTAVSNDGQNVIDQETEVQSSPRLKIREVDSEAPVRWLKQGIEDFKKIPVASASLGMVYVVIGALLVWAAWGYPVFITSLAAAFLMIGPLVAVGFYCMSCQLESGKKPSMATGLASMGFNAISLCCFALVLGVLMGVWALVSAVSVALFFDNVTVTDNVLGTLLSQQNFIPFLFTYMITAVVIAAVAFSISVISAPLITNKKVDFVTAMITSVEAVRKNPSVMLSWALMIAAMIIVGFLAGFIGLAFTLPIVGHATWHAYKDLVESTDE